MRETKESGISWVGNIPSNWKTLPNKYIMEKIKIINPIYQGEDILSLTVNGVIVRNLDAGGKMPASFDGYQILYPNNLLMCLFDYDVTPRCIGLIKNNGVSSPAYSQFIMKDGNSPRYYYYYYLMIDHTKELLHLAKNLRHSFTEEQLGVIKVPVPPIDEQNYIADYLDSKCAEIDLLSTDIQAEIDTLEEYKKSVITEAVTKGLNPNAKMKDSGIQWIGKIPSHWNSGRIGGLYSVRNTKVSDKDYPPLSVTMKGIVPQLETAAKTNDGDNRKLVKKGDFAINSRSDRRGSCGISDYDGSVSLINTVLTPRTTMVPSYYNWLFHTVNFADEFYKWGHGIVDDLWSTNWQDMKKIIIPIPPLPEQTAIANYLNRRIAEIDATLNEKKEQLSTLTEYKKSVIYEYVTGKKEVPTEDTTTVVALEPRMMLLGTIIGKLGKNQKGRIQLQKILYLADMHLGLNRNVQYYRYDHGPYDIHLSDYIDNMVKNGWYQHRNQGGALLVAGKNHADFLRNAKNMFGDKETEIGNLLNLLQSMNVLKRTRMERIATLYAAWNDFLLEGITPTDDQIIQEVMTNWTENKGNTKYETWQDSLNKMKTNGLIPKGVGLHTLPKPQKEVADNE